MPLEKDIPVETRFVIIMGIKRLAYYLPEYRASLVIALATNDTCRIARLKRCWKPMMDDHFVASKRLICFHKNKMPALPMHSCRLALFVWVKKTEIKFEGI
ncbi:uncharacterized protein [Miscanthus floridulus]|uniref:uncharacterized protein isoform X3 n=1 Tax=Miscanthus floridulus TaxID=154761 RepID=UPI00345782E8